MRPPLYCSQLVGSPYGEVTCFQCLSCGGTLVLAGEGGGGGRERKGGEGGGRGRKGGGEGEGGRRGEGGDGGVG